MTKEKINIIYSILNVIVYLLIISILSIQNFISDVIFSVGFFTLIISTFLFLLKVNLDRFRIFIWINLILLLLLYSYFFYAETVTNIRNQSSTVLHHIIFFN